MWKGVIRVSCYLGTGSEELLRGPDPTRESVLEEVARFHRLFQKSRKTGLKVVENWIVVFPSA